MIERGWSWDLKRHFLVILISISASSYTRESVFLRTMDSVFLHFNSRNFFFFIYNLYSLKSRSKINVKENSEDTSTSFFKFKKNENFVKYHQTIGTFLVFELTISLTFFNFVFEKNGTLNQTISWTNFFEFGT